MATFRGYEIIQKETGWIFVDTGKPTITTWKDRPCGHCGKYNTLKGYDGCLGYIPGLINACCGHGNCDEAYAQFSNSHRISGYSAIQFFEEKEWRKQSA